jgi:monofunctional biosynthetic peptidoglycan transglycosylase
LSHRSTFRSLPWKKIALAAPAAVFVYLSYLYLSLPDVRVLASTNPPTTAFIELRAREARANGKAPRRVQRWVRYERISSNLRRAVLVAEDSAFWEHDGVDLEQLRESIDQSIEKGKALRGGSTITQQLAKNLYLSPSRNPVRKLRELLISRKLEASLSKRRILELYLNVIEWGNGIYGAEAAARAYFGTSAAGLSAEQAALLAGAIINPRVHNPAHPTPRLRRRQQIILRRMGGVTPPPESPSTPEVSAPESTPQDVPATPESRPSDAQPLPTPDEIPEKLPEMQPEVPPPLPPPQPPPDGATFARTHFRTQRHGAHDARTKPSARRL